MASPFGRVLDASGACLFLLVVLVPMPPAWIPPWSLALHPLPLHTQEELHGAGSLSQAEHRRNGRFSRRCGCVGVWAARVSERVQATGRGAKILIPPERRLTVPDPCVLILSQGQGAAGTGRSATTDSGAGGAVADGLWSTALTGLRSGEILTRM